MHSGELFGSAGKVAVDFIAVILVLLCITGVVFAIRPKQKALLRLSLKLHDKIGRYTIAVTLLIVLTGWCLRPPVMIALVLNKIPAIPGTTLRSNNPWNDKLRMIRYDKDEHDWLVSTSEGFYSLKLNNGAMKKIESAPPVSVMGLNVLQKTQMANGTAARSVDYSYGIDKMVRLLTTSRISLHPRKQELHLERRLLLA